MSREGMTVVRTTSHQEQPSSCPERGGSCRAHAHATPSSRTGRSTGRDSVPPPPAQMDLCPTLAGLRAAPGLLPVVKGNAHPRTTTQAPARTTPARTPEIRADGGGGRQSRAPGPAPGSASRPGSHARAAVGRISRPGSMCTHGAPAAMRM